MKYFPVKIFIICILLPPVLYAISLQFIESRLTGRYSSELEDLYIADTPPLLNGTVRLKDAISDNIDRYIENNAVLSWGGNLSVTVTTSGGKLLYPDTFGEEGDELLPSDPLLVAEENFRMMNQGLSISTDLTIGHNSLLANAILIFYAILFVSIFYLNYRVAIKKVKADDLEKKETIEILMNLEAQHENSLQELDRENEKLTEDLNLLRKNLELEKTRASQNEEDLIEDIEDLENKIEKNLVLQDEQLEEIEYLKDKIKSYEKSKKRKKTSESVKKRFKVLYKNLTLNRKAVDGFIALNEDMKIKCEEIIHLLNEDPKQVTIKRKVFGKKNRETVLEVIFAYRGRLYFRNRSESKVEVLAIGTKNTQAKELGFLDSL